MATERENIPNNSGLGALLAHGYDIAGNSIRAYFDAQDNLVFVVDNTVTPDKPNALMVINSYDGRKWDDILANDYGVALEMVRPKKDNKYQKLDIEYTGLEKYADLIRDYDAGADVANALSALGAYRVAAAVRSATERLAAAEEASENARETIARAQDSVAESQERIKTLRAKLSQQKKSVGREPTKQSAAKILRTESQIDAIRDKQNRAQRRLDNARRRLVAAEEDAEIARAILARHADNADMVGAQVPTRPAPRAVAAVKSAPLPATQNVIKEEPIEQKAEEMADEEVKPLFDKDPEFLDEEIAFKPIDFNIAASQPSPQEPAEPRFDDYDTPVSPAPLSFAPPVESNDVQHAPVTAPQTTPVLDTIKSVDTPVPAYQADVPMVSDAPVMHDNAYDNSPAPARPVAPNTIATSAPARPVSPVTGIAATPVVDSGDNKRKPTFLYYVLLIILIVLSIFTLWLYQRKNSDTVPDLAATTTAAPKTEEPAAPATDDTPSPFIAVEETVTVTMPQPEPEPEPAPVVSEPEPEPTPVKPVVDETVPAIPVVPEPEPEPEPDTPFLVEAAPEETEHKSITSLIVNKLPYNAGSQNENMFVAATDYDTDVVAAPAPVPAPEDDVASDAPTCDDGTAPDTHGCCGDEQYTDLRDSDFGGFACCSQSTGDCFPPLF